MLKVELIHHTYITATNGANTVMKSLLNSKKMFAEYGIELNACTLETRCNDVYKSPSVSFKSWLRSVAKRLLTYLAKHSTWAAKSVVMASEIRPAQKIISYYNNDYENDADILFFHSIFPCYEYLKTCKKRKKVVLVLHNNGDTYKMLRIYYKSLEKSKFYKFLEEIENCVLNNVDRICFVAESASNNFIHLHPNIDPDIVKTVHNGIEYINVYPKDSLHKPIEICCVASITDRKGQKYIVEALEMFSVANMPNVHFTIIGDGEKRKLLEQRVNSNKQLSERITFVGISHDVNKYLQNSDIFILPSEDEGLPMAIIEAMRASLPIISTPVGGIPELVLNNYNGLIIEPNALQLFEILNNIQNFNWLEMGKKSRLLFDEKFTINGMINKYAEILNSLN